MEQVFCSGITSRGRRCKFKGGASEGSHYYCHHHRSSSPTVTTISPSSTHPSHIRPDRTMVTRPIPRPRPPINRTPQLPARPILPPINQTSQLSFRSRKVLAKPPILPKAEPGTNQYMKDDCPVCLENVKISEDCILVCKHALHLECAKPLINACCPICRHTFVSEDGSTNCCLSQTDLNQIHRKNHSFINQQSEEQSELVAQNMGEPTRGFSHRQGQYIIHQFYGISTLMVENTGSGEIVLVDGNTRAHPHELFQ